MGGQPRCLVVDDDVQGLDVTLRLLRRSGYRATGAQTATSAVWERGPFDVLLVDVRLPNGSVEDIAQAFPGVPVLTMSGYPGAQLQKPFTREQLVAAISGVLASRKEAAMARQSFTQTFHATPVMQERAKMPAQKRKSQWLRTVFGVTVFAAALFAPTPVEIPWKARMVVAGFGAFTADATWITDYVKAILQWIPALLKLKGDAKP